MPDDLGFVPHTQQIQPTQPIQQQAEQSESQISKPIDLGFTPHIQTPEQKTLAQATPQTSNVTDMLSQLGSGATKGFVGSFDPRNFLQLLHPLNMISDIGQQMKDVRTEAAKEPNLSDKIQKYIYGSVPVAGPMANEFFKATDAGDYEKAGTVLGQTAGMKYAPELVGKTAGLIPKTIGKVAELKYPRQLAKAQLPELFAKGEDYTQSNLPKGLTSAINPADLFVDEASVKDWFKHGADPQVVGQLATKSIVENNMDFANKRVNADAIINELKGTNNKMWNTAIPSDQMGTFKEWAQNIKKNQEIADAPKTPALVKYWGKRIVIPIAAKALGIPYAGLSGGILALSGIDGLAGKLMSNPVTAKAMLNLSKMPADVLESDPRALMYGNIIKDSLRGSAGLNLVNKDGKETPVAIDTTGRIIPSDLSSKQAQGSY